MPDGHLLVHAGDVSLVRETHPDARGWDGVGWVLKLEGGSYVCRPPCVQFKGLTLTPPAFVQPSEPVFPLWCQASG